MGECTGNYLLFLLFFVSSLSVGIYETIFHHVYNVGRALNPFTPWVLFIYYSFGLYK